MKQDGNNRRLIGNLRYYMKLVRQSGKTALAAAAVYVISAFILAVLRTYELKYIVNAVTVNADCIRLVLLIAGFTVPLAVMTLASDTCSSAIYWYSRLLRTELSKKLNEKRMEMPYQALLDEKTQSLLERARRTLTGDNAVTQGLLLTMAECACALLEIGTFAAILLGANVLVVAAVLVSAAANYLFMQRMRRREFDDRRQSAAVHRRMEYLYRLGEKSAFGKDIRIYSMTGWILSKLEALFRGRLRFDRRSAGRTALQLLFEGGTTLLRDGIVYAVLIVLFARGSLKLDDFVVYTASVTELSAAFLSMIKYYNRLKTQGMQIDELRDFMDLAREETASAVLPEAESCRIELENVSFRYGEGDSANVIENVSFVLEPGESIALVGPNGAGKSTLIQLMCGFLRPTEGTVKINGTDIAACSAGSVLSAFTAVFQDIYLLPCTVAENVSCRAEGETDMQRAEQCLRRAGLWEKIESLPQKMQTKLEPAVYDDAAGLSGGEQQKLMIARALYRDAPVLMLDEPTAALDPLAESAVYREYHEMTKGRSAVFVSHRLASTRFCDRIVVLDKGRVKEIGTHEALLQGDTLYAGMYREQSRYYTDAAVSEVPV